MRSLWAVRFTRSAIRRQALRQWILPEVVLPWPWCQTMAIRFHQDRGRKGDIAQRLAGVFHHKPSSRAQFEQAVGAILSAGAGEVETGRTAHAIGMRCSCIFFEDLDARDWACGAVEDALSAESVHREGLGGWGLVDFRLARWLSSWGIFRARAGA